MALFREIAKIVDSDEVITTDRYLDHTRVCGECTYLKSEFIYRGGKWRDELFGSLFRSPRTSNIVFGHSDKFVNSTDLLYTKLLGYKRAFGVNTKPKLDYASPLPLGLTNQTNESEFHKLFGNHELLKSASEATDALFSYKGIVTGNFSINTNRKVRLPLARLIESAYGSFEIPDFSETGRLKYLQALGESNFVVCPEGNGLDTHRLWEAIYMGSIPIIRENESIEQLVKELPVLIIKSWDQIIDQDFLERSWIEISQNESHDFSRLEVSSWINLLH